MISKKPVIFKKSSLDALRKIGGRIIPRDKIFYAVPKYFPVWDYPTRDVIGMNLNDFYWRGEPYYRFWIKNKVYEIDRDKANALGKKYRMPIGVMPYLIPLQEFKVILVLEEEEPEVSKVEKQEEKQAKLF